MYSGDKRVAMATSKHIKNVLGNHGNLECYQGDGWSVGPGSRIKHDDHPEFPLVHPDEQCGM